MFSFPSVIMSVLAMQAGVYIREYAFENIEQNTVKSRFFKKIYLR